MHYCFVVITKEFPTDDVLSKALNPFNEEKFYEKFEDVDEIPAEEYPVFTWDWWQVGGRYGGNLKLKIDFEDEEYRWQFYAKKDETRAGRLFRSKMCETLDSLQKGRMLFTPIEDDYRGYLGSRDGYIRVDGCKVKDVIDFEETVINHGFGFIGKDGEIYARESWNGHDFIKDEHYEEKVKEAIKDVQDCYVTYVDCHD